MTALALRLDALGMPDALRRHWQAWTVLGVMAVLWLAAAISVGALSLSPQSELDKEYVVRVRGQIDDRRLGLLRHGLELDGRQLKPAKVTPIADQTLRFVLTEGRNRQIRRMCDMVGLAVADLLRVRIGPLHLGDLAEGRWRRLTAAERAALIAASDPGRAGSTSRPAGTSPP